ncbi:Auxin-responsive protein IAA34 [Hibiscus syriacus]|uniref:Auxin-responsive protein n=1 Tax=Hibiscus syriacus TaxID=106335 RepID=A0A6A3BCR5_HIBSY|nr:Auxin-responsive protein IAA34 [Hibiscus syriacus]
MIDLGLSLRTLQPQPYHPSTHYRDDEAEGVQSKERWAYVKVNMDGVMVGRKVCMLDQGGYLGLARQLEDMFGKFESI